MGLKEKTKQKPAVEIDLLIKYVFYIQQPTAQSSNSQGSTKTLGHLLHTINFHKKNNGGETK